MFRIRTAREIAQQIIARVVARSTLTDVAPGDPMTQIVGAVAVAVEAAYLEIARLLADFSVDSASGEGLDRRVAEILPGDLLRQGATFAVGQLQWQTAAPVAVEVTIPAGTQAAAPGSPRRIYVTTVPGRIAVGATQSDRNDGTPGQIPARAVTAGVAGNAELDTVKIVQTAVPNAVAVTNPIPFAGGQDRETDDGLRARARAYVRSLPRAIPEALEQRALEAEVDGRRVVVAKVWEDPVNRGEVTLYIDDGTGAVTETAAAAGEDLTDAGSGAVGGEQGFNLSSWPVVASSVTVYRNTGGGDVELVEGTDYYLVPSRGFIWLDPAVFPTGLDAGDALVVDAYTYYTGLIQRVQVLIEGTPNDPENTAWRSAGVNVTVAQPIVRLVSLRGTITVRDGDRPAILTEVRRRLSAYVNGLNVGDAVVRSEIIERAMGVPGMYDFDLELPAANIPTAYNEVARLTSANLDIT